MSAPATFSSERSPQKASPVLPAAFLAAASSRSANMTRAPSASRRRAIASPLPPPAPVTISTRFGEPASPMGQDRAALAESGVGEASPGVEHFGLEIGRASCWASVCQYVLLSVVAGSLKKNNVIELQSMLDTL